MGDRFSVGVVANFLGAGLSGVFLLGANIYLANHLGAERYGHFVLCQLVAMLAYSFVTLGWQAATINLVSNKSVGVLEASLYTLVHSAVFGLVCLPAVWLLARFIVPSAFGDERWLILGLAVSLVFCKIQVGVTLGRSLFRLATLVSLAKFFLLFVLILAAKHAGKLTPQSALILFAVVEVFECLFHLGFNLTSRQPSITGFPGFTRLAFSYGVRAQLASLTSMLNYRADIIIINLFHGPQMVAYYKVAVDLAEKMWIIPMSIGKTIFSKSTTLGKGEKVVAQATKAVQLSFYSTVLIAGGGVLAASILFHLLYKEEYHAGIPCFRLLAIGILAGSIVKIISNYISALGRPEINSLHTGISLVVNIAVNLLLIPSFGAIGAAVGTSVAYVVLSLVKLNSTKRYLGGVLGSWWIPPDLQKIRLRLSNALFGLVRK